MVKNLDFSYGCYKPTRAAHQIWEMDQSFIIDESMKRSEDYGPEYAAIFILEVLSIWNDDLEG